jgi:hypothetical protein
LYKRSIPPFINILTKLVVLLAIFLTSFGTSLAGALKLGTTSIKI